MVELKTESITEKLKFKGNWRNYQQNCLNLLDKYLDDNKLNIVAAPGAGKTILGIEVISRLKQNVIIFTPTITIRNQWKQRICDNFLEDEKDYDKISLKWDNVQPITILTYQSLNSIFKNKEKREVFIQSLEEQKIRTIVLDEAHHLRDEWYRTLNKLISSIDSSDLKTVSLTGTPPYDVPLSEWKNYNEISGPIDAEISIPELVKAGDLCPHQDLIYFSDLTAEEKEIRNNFEKSKDEFFKYLKNSSEFLYEIKNSPFFKNLEQNIEIIYENTDFTVSLISWLLNNDELDIEASLLINFLGLEKEKIPKFDYKQAEILINGIIDEYEKYFKNSCDIKQKLKELNLFAKTKKVDFLGEKLKQLTARGANKIYSIKKITEAEADNLKNNLREVILLDYISKGDGLRVNIVSVFDEIKSFQKLKNIKIGILTGSLVVIPKNAKDILYKTIEKFGLKPENIIVNDFEEGFLRINTYQDANIAPIITELFYRGEINVLIGTAALLGEGWDCPAVNSLIIASVVGSFMLSNQMRGRALRIDKNNKNKTANIWHLASISDNSSEDFETIEKRFQTFEGVSYLDNKIQNGVKRLNLISLPSNKKEIEEFNKYFIELSKKRAELKTKWKQVFDKSEITDNAVTSGIYEVVETEKATIQFINKKPAFIPFLFVYNLALKFITKEKLRKKEKIADCILKTLCEAQIIKTPYNELELKTFSTEDFTGCLTLLNSTTRERNVFINSLKEFYTIPEKQKYIIKKKNKYIIPPNLIASNKRFTETFAKYLEHDLGYLDIIMTRTPNGWMELLKAKYNLYFDDKITENRIWI